MCFNKVHCQCHSANEIAAGAAAAFVMLCDNSPYIQTILWEICDLPVHRLLQSA